VGPLEGANRLRSLLPGDFIRVSSAEAAATMDLSQVWSSGAVGIDLDAELRYAIGFFLIFLAFISLLFSSPWSSNVGMTRSAKQSWIGCTLTPVANSSYAGGILSG